MDQNRLSFGAGLPLATTTRLDVLRLQQWIPMPRAGASENNRTRRLVLHHTGKARWLSPGERFGDTLRYG